MEVALGDARYIFVSGTASIDERGATVHGAISKRRPATRSTCRVPPRRGGARLAHIAQATAFLKHRDDGKAFERFLARTGLEQAPIVATVSDVCRDDLLFEIDATAVVAAPPDRT